MDWQKVCIIDNQNDEDITNEVLSIEEDTESARYVITFHTSQKIFKYGTSRITIIENPEPIDITNKFVFIRGEFQTEVKSILKFGVWCKIQGQDDTITTIKYSELILLKDRRTEHEMSRIMNYILDAASLEVKDEEEQGFLLKQLNDLPIREDSVLSAFLSDSSPIQRKDNKPIIAPFSSNSSQLSAIDNALHNNISVIQGPPGTGKTQTILNIISNLLMRGKTIAVVSGNNEATKNVFEKLEKENLGSLCALLGNKENINAFFEKQPSKKELKEILSSFSKSINESKMKALEIKIQGYYEAILKRAKLKARIDELSIEKEVLGVYRNSIESSIPKKLKVKYSSEKYLEKAAYLETLYSTYSLAFLIKLEVLLNLGFWPTKNFNLTETIDYLQHKYYISALNEANKAINDIDAAYPQELNNQLLTEYKSQSLSFLMHKLKEKYSSIEDQKFYARSYKQDSSFLDHFPIVLSTTHSLQSCTPKGTLYDYVIIDEASQVNITSAFIALAYAKNAVIVGDSKQLPHVVPNVLKGPLDALLKKYNPPPYIDYKKYSLLESVLAKFNIWVPKALLREHYRCDPEIIGFCNKRFYNNELILQTIHRENCGITIIETPSHTAFGRTNERQAEIIRREIIPTTEDANEIGVVAPYRDQVNLIRNRIHRNEILVDTVHKFQGKERATMVLSTTSDRTTVSDDPERIDFLNDPNLINVAVSRAKDKLYVIASTEALNQSGTLIGDLYEYACYYSKDSRKIKTNIYSVFDLMYDNYAPILNKMKSKLKKQSNFDSENIVATIIDDICKSNKYGVLSYKFNYPLRKILRIDETMDAEDKAFISNPATHCDFIIFSQLSKQIKLAVEVDGMQHEKYIQKERDERKDRLLKEAGIKQIRIKTKDIYIKQAIESALR